jgi:hypothetical protein
MWKMLPKIYLYCDPYGKKGDVLGFALAEDGTGLASHLSSSLDFSRHDMGLTSDWKHECYAKHYSDGYELVWIDDPDNHAGWKAAFEKNRMAEDGR